VLAVATCVAIVIALRAEQAPPGRAGPHPARTDARSTTASAGVPADTA
jgi:hypothetical protein